MSDQKKSDAPNTTFITLQVPVDLLEKFIEHRKDAEREHQLMQEEIYRANDTIYSAFEDVERCHRDCEEAIEQMEEVAGDIKKALMQQLATNPNDNCLAGLRCPECGSYGPFNIRATALFKVADDGTEVIGAVEWDDASFCECPCGFGDDVGAFTEKE